VRKKVALEAERFAAGDGAEGRLHEGNRSERLGPARHLDLAGGCGRYVLAARRQRNGGHDQNGAITIEELLLAVANALAGCETS